MLKLIKKYNSFINRRNNSWSLEPFELKQVLLLAKYHPFSKEEVERVFVKVGKSFDKTKAVLRAVSLFNLDISNTINFGKKNE